MRTNALNPPKGGTMSDNRKYYYLKLKENYFDEDAIVLLESKVAEKWREAAA